MIPWWSWLKLMLTLRTNGKPSRPSLQRRSRQIRLIILCNILMGSWRLWNSSKPPWRSGGTDRASLCSRSRPYSCWWVDIRISAITPQSTMLTSNKTLTILWGRWERSRREWVELLAVYIQPVPLEAFKERKLLTAYRDQVQIMPWNLSLKEQMSKGKPITKSSISARNLKTE